MGGGVKSWLRFIRDRRWTEAQKRALLALFNNPQTLYQQPIEQLKLAKQLLPNNCPSVSNADLNQDLRWLECKGNHLISINDSRYPPILKEIHDPPMALFASGDLACLQEPKVAMVGSRQPSPVGAKVAQQLASELASLGIVIVSGMALGIDGAAHFGALQTSTATIGVMGCGLDIVYPDRHRKLFQNIADQGCLLSEYPLGLPPTKYTFPQRNRIVSGLSLGVIIVEAAVRSGTLITARLAGEQDREVMVVPGSALSAQYRGSHSLIKEGAAVITEAQDVLNLLSLPLRAMLPSAAIDKPEDELSEKLNNPLLAHLSDEPYSIDKIIQASGLTASEVSSMLLLLEVEGLVAMTTDGGYVRLC